ncbi:TonB-dependent receptor plug domain-containing protein [Rhodocytophaga rosea]|uniref:TonB-dependent receptor plug domain-containing protein n=1 Tax=Rhodocytophaga rosea TaxID=2704465 RepID=UPI001E3C144F|nr:TonB-dependent receptor plug domain-containing protein [Rhodocytophaga rosea]
MNRILRCSFILLLTCLGFLVQAQNKTITGKVTSLDSREGLPGVNVTVKGTTTGTSTDADGNYSLGVPPNATLTFSFIGLTTQEIAVGNRSEVNVQMSDDVKTLTEVVVVGYGTQERKDLTGSLTSVSAKDIENVPVVSFEQAIQGRATGVQIESSSGKVGGAMKIRVRGSASVSAGNQPLYVVDGFPITQESTGDPTNEDTNPLIDINPNDIESVQILKDASSAAIYGSRASNGVVLITTKRGKAGKTNFNINFSQGQSKPTDLLKFLNRNQYIQIVTDAVNNYNQLYSEPEDYITPADIYYPTDWDTELSYNADTDWQKKAYRTAQFQQLDVSASGVVKKQNSILAWGIVNKKELR